MIEIKLPSTAWDGAQEGVEALLDKWQVAEKTVVTKGQVLATVVLVKASIDIEAPENGWLEKIRRRKRSPQPHATARIERRRQQLRRTDAGPLRQGGTVWVKGGGMGGEAGKAPEDQQLKGLPCRRQWWLGSRRLVDRGQRSGANRQRIAGSSSSSSGSGGSGAGLAGCRRQKAP